MSEKTNCINCGKSEHVYECSNGWWCNGCGCGWSNNEESAFTMPTQSLTDQLRLLEEEIERLQDLPDRLGKGGLYRAAKKLLAVAKGLEAELTKAQADLLPHYAAIKAGDKLVDELSNERDALRAENGTLQETIRTLLASAFPSKKEHPGMYAAWQKAEAALASLSK